MKNFVMKHQIMFTCFVIAIMAISGLICVYFVPDLYSYSIIAFIWLLPVSIGLLLFLVSLVLLVFNRKNHSIWENAFIFGIWLLFVSFASFILGIGVIFAVPS